MSNLALVRSLSDDRARFYGLPLPKVLKSQRDVLRIASAPSPTLAELLPVLTEMAAAFVAAKKEREELQKVRGGRQMMFEVCAAYGVPFSDVMSRRRYPEVVDAKHEIMWRLSKTRLNYSEIARALGMHHTSVMHGVRRHQARIDAGEVTAP